MARHGNYKIYYLYQITIMNYKLNDDFKKKITVIRVTNRQNDDLHSKLLFWFVRGKNLN